MDLFKNDRVKSTHFYREWHFHIPLCDEMIFPLPLGLNYDLVPASIFFSLGQWTYHFFTQRMWKYPIYTLFKHF